MSRKLKIYACSGIGNAGSEYNYWLDNTQTVSNTQAVNSLLSMINLCYSEVKNLGLGTSEIVDRLNQIDLYSVAMYYAQVYQDSVDDLHRAGQVIGCLLDKGAFDYDSISNDERDKHLDDVFEKVADVIADDTLRASGDFTQWWKENVEDKNRVFLSKEQQEQVTSILEKLSRKISGIGKAGDEWEKNPDLAKYLNNASEYFLYTYFTDEQLRGLPQVFRAKKIEQLKTYEYAKQMYVGVYGSEDSYQNTIRAGIIDYFKHTPEEVCTKIATAKSQDGVGAAVAIALTAAQITEIVLAALSAVAAIIGSILMCVSSISVAKYNAQDVEIAQSATPNSEDFDGLKFDDMKKSPVLLIAALSVLYLIFKK